MKRFHVRILSFMLILCMTTVLLAGPVSLAAENNAASSYTTTVYGTGNTAYKAYRAKHQTAPTPDETMNLDIPNYTSSEGYAKVVQNAASFKGNSVQTADEGYIEWTFDVKETGLYNIGINYYPTSGKGASIVRSLELDGKVPFDEAGSLTFSRCFTNAGAITTDDKGNQIRPSQVEAPQWMWQDLCDSRGYYSMPFQFYMTAGKHTLRLDSVREPMTISAIKIYQTALVPSYAQLKKSNQEQGYKNTSGKYIEIQGEDAACKSTNTIYPITDNSSSATHPSSYSKTLLNTIGGEKWGNSGEWVEWKFNVTEAGYYTLGIKARQNINAGQPTYRKIYIDNEVLCQDLMAVKFPYSSQWEMKTIGENDPDFFYFFSGEHTIRMEVTLGELSDLVQRVNESMAKLNQIYMNFLMIIGPSPDTSRDYFFDQLLPNDLKELHNQGVLLNQICKEYIKVNGMNSSQAQQLKNIADQAEKMSADPNKIAKMMNDFVNNISALGTWITTVMKQPLEIDYITVASPGVNLPKTNGGFLDNIGFAFNQFLATFYRDYTSVSAAGEGIKVWISSGRDQANALNQLIINNFTANTGIHVNLELVPANSLLSATLANKGPDVALSCTQSEPINYAIRGAVVDLSQFSDYADVEKRFMPSAMLPMTFNGHIYGLPETQDFPMSFYRKDVLNKLKLTVPQTWDDVIAMLPILQKKHLNFGLPQPYAANLTGAGLNTYAMYLYQQGGAFYNEIGSKSMLDTTRAIDAFYKWTEFYNGYSLPTSYSFVSRFRTGEIPIGIAGYGTYNTLSVFAPELNGVWEFALVPGTKQTDGSVNRTVASAVTATILLANAKDKNACWSFIKWWISAATQEKYGNEIESIMGTAGRYQTANIEALYHIPWATKDADILMKQWQYTKGIPEVPGSYMTPRYVDFAFKQAYSATANANSEPGEVLLNASEQINVEIKDKRAEFGLSN